MSNNQYKDIFNKIEIDNKLKTKTKNSILNGRKKSNFKKYGAIAASFAIILTLGISYTSLNKNQISQDKYNSISEAENSSQNEISKADSTEDIYNNTDDYAEACMANIFVYNDSIYLADQLSEVELSNINLKDKKGKELGTLNHKITMNSTQDDYKNFAATVGVGGKLYEYNGLSSNFKIILDYNGELTSYTLSSFKDENKSLTGEEMNEIFKSAGGIKELKYWTYEYNANSESTPVIIKTITDTTIINQLIEDISSSPALNVNNLGNEYFNGEVTSNTDIFMSLVLADGTYINTNLSRGQYISFTNTYYYELSKETINLIK
ncbi:MAG: hypothetical protein RR620_01245 [Clostridium sp.]